MPYQEIDNFDHKFKPLCQGGRTACLTVSFKAGKAIINIRVDLDVLPQQNVEPRHPQRLSKNGPAQQWQWRRLLIKLLVVLFHSIIWPHQICIGLKLHFVNNLDFELHRTICWILLGTGIYTAVSLFTPQLPGLAHQMPSLAHFVSFNPIPHREGWNPPPLSNFSKCS